MPIKILIITGANTVREINPLGEIKPKIEISLNHKFMSNRKMKEWEKAESSLKEYRIHGVYLKNSLPDRLTRWNRLHISTVEKLYPIGSTHKFEVSEETLTAIIL